MPGDRQRPQQGGRHVDPTTDRPAFMWPAHRAHKKVLNQGHKTQPPKRKGSK